MSEDRRESEIPREIQMDCSHCGGNRLVPNPEWCRLIRRKAKLTLREVSRLGNVSISYLGRMETGESPLTPEVAALYVRLFERRRKAGHYLDEP